MGRLLANRQYPCSPRCNHRLRRQLTTNVELQTASHAIHTDIARSPAPQIHDQAYIGRGQKHQNHDVGEVHALI